MIAAQVGAKSVRDAFFLSWFDVELLPAMVIVGALLSMTLVPVFSHLMVRYSPARVVPTTYLVAAASFAGVWAIGQVSPRVAAVVLFLVVAALGALLISGFWSVINERFDPYSGKRFVARIGWGATAGGLAGGLLAERLAAAGAVTYVLLVLAALQVLCAVLLRRVSSTAPVSSAGARESGPKVSLLTLLKERPYLGQLAALVFLLTLTAAVVDYSFKAEAVARYQGEELLRVLAVFYTATGLLAFLVQSVLGAWILQHVGLARTASILPITTAVTAVCSAIWPGFAGAATVRASDETLRNSVHRSAYELLYVPLAPAEKRRFKSIIDVGVDRGGTTVGGLLVGGLVLLGVAEGPVLMAIAALFGLVALAVTRALSRGYIEALESSLVTQAEELDILEGVEDVGLRSMLMQTLGVSRINELDPKLSQKLFSTSLASRPAMGDRPRKLDLGRAEPAQSEDPYVQRVADLRSREKTRVERALGDGLQPEMVGHVVPLLAWNEVASKATDALIRLGSRCQGQLIDALLDPDEDFAIRRRLPAAIVAADSPRAARGLLAGLHDTRFEVRYRCARALTQLRHHLDPGDQTAVYDAVVREVSVSHGQWKNRRLLDESSGRTGAQAIVGGDEGSDSTRSLDHVFTLLGLVISNEPLRVAYRGLKARDEALRGTALEYLDRVLPARIREPLWPLLEL